MPVPGCGGAGLRQATRLGSPLPIRRGSMAMKPGDAGEGAPMTNPATVTAVSGRHHMSAAQRR